MGIFSRFRDIVAANINSMLDKAENPEKLLMLMIQEMEDTLVEMKANCAGSLAARTRLNRSLSESTERAQKWEERARLALTRGREDLAREALLEKRTFQSEVDRLDRDYQTLAANIDQSLREISQLEEKLASARKKYRALLDHRLQPGSSPPRLAPGHVPDTADPFERFAAFEKRLEGLGEEPAAPNARRGDALEKEIDRLQHDDALERELMALKGALPEAGQPVPPSAQPPATGEIAAPGAATTGS